MRRSKCFILLIAVVFLNSTIICNAQDEPEKKFIFRSNKVQLSTFFVTISPMTDFAKLNGEMVNVGVFSGGFILNDKFSISFFSSTAPKVNRMPIPEFGSDKYDEWVEAGVKLYKLPSSQELVYVDFRHSGLKFDYLHKTNRMLFWKAGLSFGFLGGLTLSENQTFLGLFNNVIYKESVISLEPEFGMGVNLLSWWRIYLDAGYRLIGADTRIMSAADTDSFTFSLTFAFGGFGK